MMNSGHLFWTQTRLVSQPINWIIMRTHAKKREKDGAHTVIKFIFCPKSQCFKVKSYQKVNSNFCTKISAMKFCDLVWKLTFWTWNWVLAQCVKMESMREKTWVFSYQREGWVRKLLTAYSEHDKNSICCKVLFRPGAKKC